MSADPKTRGMTVIATVDAVALIAGVLLTGLGHGNARGLGVFLLLFSIAAVVTVLVALRPSTGRRR